MAYFTDLSPYNYHPFESQSSPTLLTVGWLDSIVTYNTGVVESAILDKLLKLCREPVNRTRGLHRCPFCDSHPVVMTVEGHPITLGNAEIRVKGPGAIVFAAPTLICHYIKRHGYRPPDLFLAAVCMM